MRDDARGSRLLALGALAGVLLAAGSIAARGPRTGALPAGAVATVEGSPILRSEYARSLASAANDRREGLTEPLRRHVLDRLIDEELLVQRGLELGLPARDPRLRAALVTAVLELLASDANQARDPADAELRAFFEENRDHFRAPLLARVDQIFFRTEDAARSAQSRLAAGERFERVRADGDEPPVRLPEGPLPMAKLYDYLGPSLTRAIFELSEGAISRPLRSADGYHLLRLVARNGGAPLAFEDAREAVKAEHRRRGGDRRVRRFLEQRRSEVEIRMDGSL